MKLPYRKICILSSAGLIGVFAGYQIGTPKTPIVIESNGAESDHLLNVENEPLNIEEEIPDVQDPVYERPEWANTLVTPANAIEIDALREKLLAWAVDDPEGALEYSNQYVRPLGDSLDITKEILVEWAKEAPQESWQWCLENSPFVRNDVIKAIASYEPELGWALATELVAQTPEDVRFIFDNAMEGIASAGEHRKAIDILMNSTIQNSENHVMHGKYSFVETVLQDWMRYDPEGGKEWLSELLVSGKDNNLTMAAFTAVRQEWVGDNPREALEFGTSLPDGEPRHALVTRALDYLVQFDDVAVAAEWLNENGHTEDYESNVSAVAIHHQTISEDPAKSLEWADSIQHPYLREQTFNAVISKWLAIDNEAAEAHIAKNPNILSKENLAVARSQADYELQNPSYTKELAEAN